MKRKIIPRSEYEVYFMETLTKRPGKNEIRKALRAQHPFYSNAMAVSHEEYVIAGKRFEMVTVFEQQRRLAERIFAPRRRTQTQALVARFAHASPCVVRALDELLVLEEKPESIRLSGRREESDKARLSDYDITEITDERNALSGFIARGSIILAIAAFIPLAFAIACAGISNSGVQVTTPNAVQAVFVPVHESVDFFSCLKEDIDAVNDCGGVIESWRYDGHTPTRVSMKISGGKISKLGERLTKVSNISDISIPGVSFDKGWPEYTVSCTRAAGSENKGTSLDWSQEQDLETSCAKAGIKIERLSLSPVAECSFSMEAGALSSCVSLLASFCDRESLDIKTGSINSGNGFSVTVSFADRNETRTAKGPNAESIGGAFRLPAKRAEKKETDIHPVVGKISEGGKKTVTFRKSGTGKICNEGGFE